MILNLVPALMVVATTAESSGTTGFEKCLCITVGASRKEILDLFITKELFQSYGMFHPSDSHRSFILIKQCFSK